MADSHYQADRAGMAAWLRSPEAAGIVHDAAESGAHYAAASAPRRSGRYASHIEVQRATGWDGRAAADIVATEDYSGDVEARHHVLRRTAQMIEAGS